MEKEKRNGRTLLKIFITTLYLSTFTFGGGYVIVSLMKKKFVDENHWIEQDEMLDLVAIAQSSPGPIAVNGAIAVGYKLCGIAGALVAIVGTIIPPFVIISIISYCYSAFRSNWMISQMLEGMQAGVAAVIASVTYDMGADIVKQRDDLGVLVMIAAFVASYILEINVVFIVIVCGLVGVCRGQLEKRRERGHKKTEYTSDENPEKHPDKGGME
ncbi:chromate transporter [Coprococcus eutactus]|uniref:chromate transporter n=1 Tax=Coprococcus eutactus TaxID=33043 RepID=UPI00321B01C8